MLRLSRRTALVAAPLLLLPGLVAAQTPDPAVLAKIRDEGMNRSQVMQTVSTLTDVIGPRLTASPGMRRANEWTKDKLTEWGLQYARLEPWGPFGRGWSLEKFSLQMVGSTARPLTAFPFAWSPGWRGTSDVVYFDPKDQADMERFKGKFKGKIVLSGPPRETKAWFSAPGSRYSDEDLAAMEAVQPGQGRPPRRGGPNGAPPGGPGGARPTFIPPAVRLTFLQKEGAALIITPSRNGDGGTLFLEAAQVPPQGEGQNARRIAPYDPKAPKIVPQIAMANEDYNRLVRMIQQGATPRLSVDLAVKFHDKDLMGYNTVAEIPGSDLKDQVVMLGGHLDSWHSATGATDNAAGVSVCMEAVRILKTLGIQPRRTIRIALWTGEEQGLYGSRAYVAQHFNPNKVETLGTGISVGGVIEDEAARKRNRDNFQAYFNLDNGTGKIRGIYCQGNAAIRPIFQSWLEPFADLGAKTTTVANTGGTDHQSFDGVGLPGFQFIQDGIEYDTRTHHSNQDNYDRLQADDMKQASVIMATFIYNAAMRDELLPRKTPPTPTATR